MINVDVISGFLGAGKTTLLAKYAAYRIRKGEKIAIVENEFGEIGIDSLFLMNEGLTVHEIVNGCICCSLKGEIISALKNLASDGNCQRVIIEPTGIFMLNEIYEILNAPELRSSYRVGAIVTVVDAVNYLKQKRKYEWFFSNQIKWAHRIILSKTQLVDESTILETIYSLQGISENIDIEAGRWDSFRENDWERVFKAASKKLEVDNCINTPVDDCETHSDDCETHSDDCGHTHTHNDTCEHSHNDYNMHNHKPSNLHQGFQGVSVASSRSFSEYSLKETVKMLSSGLCGDIPRAKGIVADEANGSIEFDYVNGELDIRKRQEPIERKFVNFIGTGIQKGALSKLF